MALLDKLTTAGSVLTDLDGKTPKAYGVKGISNYEKDLATSQLDLGGKSPLKYDGVSNYEKVLATSQLDLDGKTPVKYSDNLPR
jgi:hypothetical protein